MKTVWKGIFIIILAIVAALLLAAPAFSQPVYAEGLPGALLQQTLPSNTEPYAVGWGTLTLINAGLAQGKNRKGLNWFLLSFVLGPIATFLLVAFFPKLPEPRQEQVPVQAAGTE